MKSFLVISALFLGSATASAQTVVLEDDFRDGMVDPMWTVTFNPFIFWNVVETADEFHYMGVTTPFGATDERYALNATVPGGLGGTWQVDAALSWNEQIGFNPGENSMVFHIRMLDVSGGELASFRIDDTSSTDGGDVTLFGTGNAVFPSIPPNSDCEVSLWRDPTNTTYYSLDVTGGPSATGVLGLVNGVVDQVEFYVSHTAMGGPFGPFLAQLHLDYIRVWDAPRNNSVFLSTPGLIAGAPATFSIVNATASGTVFLGYSLAGNGPTATPYGTADLSAPINNFPPVLADPAGNATINVNVPAGTSGTTVWFQALDLGAGELSNGIAETVL
ncbi:MAG: hypothetical protein ACPG31_01270 [Planctomycetota bacterium]